MTRHPARPRRAPEPRPAAGSRSTPAAPFRRRTPPLEDPVPAAAPGAGPALAAGLALLVATRALVAAEPSMRWWGWNAHRFLDAWWAWAPWALAALALVPPIARAAAGVVVAMGRAIERRTALAALIAAAGAAALVAAFPDRIHFVGDSMLRLGALARGEDPRALSPQAFPLDVLIHYAAPFELVRAGRIGPQAIVLVIGAAGAGLLAAAAVAMARALHAGPAARAAAAAIALCGGYLCLYTGESKAFAEMVALVVAFAACGFAAVTHEEREAAGARPPAAERRDASSWALLGAGACIAVGVLLHRFALGLLPAWILIWVLHGRPRPVSFGARTAAALAVMVPMVVLAVMVPRIVDTVVRYDLGTNFANAETRQAGGVLAAAFDPARLIDVANLVLFLVPLAILAVVVAPWVLGREAGAAAAVARRPGAVALAIAAPFLAVFLLARPPQGLVRDWDSFATAAAALAVLSAWTVARALDRAARPWLAVPVIVVAAMTSVQWLAHHADETRSLARLEALMVEPPQRPAADRARTWDVVGWRHFGAQRYAEASRAFEQATQAAPSPRNLTHWAMAEVMTGDHRQALELYTRATARDTNFVLAWIGLGVAAINLGDDPATVHAARHLLRLAPEHERTQAIVKHLQDRGIAP